MLYRTLLVGLGGTGVDVLRKFKTHYVKYGGEEHREHIKLLGIDTDVQQGGSEERLSSEEFLHIAKAPLTLDLVRSQQNLDTFAWMANEQIPNFKVEQGAGQKRLAGYLAYLWDGSEVRQRIASAVDQLYNTRVSDRLRNLATGAVTRVFVVSSICGGTGTGLFLDVSFLIDDIFRSQGWSAKRFGVLFTPGAFPKIKQNATAWASVRANGYAALEELNFYMQASYSATLPSPVRSSAPLSVTGAVFDSCFLIGGQDERGQIASESVDLYRQTANFLFSAIKFPRIGEQLVSYGAVNEQGSYAAIGSFTLPLPQAQFTERYMTAMGKELLADLLASESVSGVSTEDFLSTTRFREAQNPENSQFLSAATTKMDHIFVFPPPRTHDEADLHMREETASAERLLAELRETASTDAKAIVKSIMAKLEGEAASDSRIEEGVLASRAQAYKALAARIGEAAARPPAQAGTGNLETLLSGALAKPGLFKKRSSPEVRFSQFETSLRSAIRASIITTLQGELTTELHRARTEAVSRATSLNLLLQQREVQLDRYVDETARYLQARRGEASGGGLHNTAFAENIELDDRYKEERYGFLNFCKAGIGLKDILRDGGKLDLERFVEKMYGLSEEWVHKHISIEQTLDGEGFARGLNQAWTMLQLTNAPGRSEHVTNSVFYPPDPALKLQLETRLNDWHGAANAPPVYVDDPDTDAVTLIRLRKGFDLKDLLEVEDLNQAYRAALQNPQRAPFLAIPTHSRLQVRKDPAEENQARDFALALALEILEPFGLNYRLEGLPLLSSDEPDPIKARLAARAAMQGPTGVAALERGRSKVLTTGGNPELIALLKNRGIALYGVLPTSSYLRLMMEQERDALVAYRRGLGDFQAF